MSDKSQEQSGKGQSNRKAVKPIVAPQPTIVRRVDSTTGRFVIRQTTAQTIRYVRKHS
jgi:hypothetical protein